MDKEFVKDKYYFSEENKLMLVRSVEEKNELKKEISLYLQELKEFKINIKQIEKESPNYITRNLLINVAHYFITENRWMQKLYKSRELPIGNLSRELGISKITIGKWEKHLITYIILLSDSKFKRILQYLNIKESHEVLGEKHIEEREIYNGIILHTKGKSYYILTTDGQVKYITNKEVYEVADEVSGALKKKLKDYKKPILITLTIFIMIISAFIYRYNISANTIIINSNIKVKLKVNHYGKVIYTYSESNSGKKMLESIDIKHKGIDEGIKDIISYMNEKEIFPQGNTSIIVSGKKPIDNKYLKVSEAYIKEHKLPIIINNNGIEYNLK